MKRNRVLLIIHLISLIAIFTNANDSQSDVQVNITNPDESNTEARTQLDQEPIQRPKTYSDEIEDQIRSSSNEDWDEDNGDQGAAEEETEEVNNQPDPSQDQRDLNDTEKAIWEKELSEFEPTDMLTILIGSRSTEAFYLNMTDVPSPIQIAIFVIEEDAVIDFTVFNPDETRLMIRKNMNHDFFNLVAVMQGEFRISMHNPSVSMLM